MPLDILVGSDFPLRIEDRTDYRGAVFCSRGIVGLDSIFRRVTCLSRLSDAHEELQIGLSFSILAAGPQKEVQIRNSLSASSRRSNCQLLLPRWVVINPDRVGAVSVKSRSW